MDRISKLKDGIVQYSKDTGSLPVSTKGLAQLTIVNDDSDNKEPYYKTFHLSDSWGRPIEYDTSAENGKNGFLLVSRDPTRHPARRMILQAKSIPVPTPALC
ncbi:MAG: hypothetical protein CM1200mP34_4770 [Verrucomicrobiales bacterium]|nr:MAG: hypothetical protein CM1200mP34_4770 [Verrucomicrobiales bacterium]